MKKPILATLALLSLSLNATESRLDIRYRDPKGVGYDTGYATADYLLTQQFDASELLFNARGHLFNDARFALNGGIGWRTLFKEEKLLLGGNFFYDFRESEHLHSNQIGAGLELLHKHFDVRLNGYLPVGKNRSFNKKRFEEFSGNTIVVRQKVLSTLPSAELELGIPLGPRFYIAGGPYYLFHQEAHGTTFGEAWGGRFRASVDLGRYFTLEGVVTYDRIFHTRGQGALSFHIFPLLKEKTRSLRKVPIYRNEIIPIQKKKRRIGLYSGSEEERIEILFVNNMFEGQGAGTFEAPFSSLKEAEVHSSPGDVIYVYPGDETPHNMDEGIVLKEDQILASSGAPLEIEDMIIPPMTPGKYPVIANKHPEFPVVINPGASHLESFRIIEAWEYLLHWNGGNGSFDLSSSSDSAPVLDPHPLGGPPQNFDDAAQVPSGSESFIEVSEPGVISVGSEAGPGNSTTPDNLSDAPSDNFVNIDSPGKGVESGTPSPDALSDSKSNDSNDSGVVVEHADASNPGGPYPFDSWEALSEPSDGNADSGPGSGNLTGFLESIFGD